MKQKQQQELAKDKFTKIAEIQIGRIVPFYKDETWSADLFDKSSLSKKKTIKKLL